MSTGIVYEGVTPQGGGGGTLFKGKKFWVAQRVPMRAACLRNIEVINLPPPLGRRVVANG